MTENIIVRFSVPSLKSIVKLISKDELRDCCLKSWLGDKTNQMQQGVAMATLCHKDSQTKQGKCSTTNSK